MATPGALRAAQGWAIGYRRLWRSSLFTTTVVPVIYLAAMGVGLGSLINRNPQGSPLDGVDYLTFLAPGLLAAAAMQTAAVESTWPVLASIKWVGTYKTMLASPLGILDVALGHLLWMALRVTLTSVVFTAVIVGFGAARSPEVVLAVPAAVLTGMAFATPITAYTATLERDIGLAALMRFVIVPLFLFSGTFFPVSQLPDAIRPVAYATPLWHGVELCRSLALGTARPTTVFVHVAYLGAWAAGGAALAVVRLRRRLVT